MSVNNNFYRKKEKENNTNGLLCLYHLLKKVKTHQPSRSSEGCRKIDAE